MLHTTFGPHHCRRHLLQRLHHHQPHVSLAHFSRVRVSASYCFRAGPGDRLFYAHKHTHTVEQRTSESSRSSSPPFFHSQKNLKKATRPPTGQLWSHTHTHTHTHASQRNNQIVDRLFWAFWPRAPPHPFISLQTTHFRFRFPLRGARTRNRVLLLSKACARARSVWPRMSSSAKGRCKRNF